MKTGMWLLLVAVSLAIGLAVGVLVGRGAPVEAGEATPVASASEEAEVLERPIELASKYRWVEEGAGEKAVNMKTLAGKDLIGWMGIPIGHVVKVKGVTFSGKETRMKMDVSSYLFRVTEIEGRKLEQPVEMRLQSDIHGRNAPLASNSYDLYKVKTGQELKTLDSEEFKAMEAAYLGKEFDLLVYEHGICDGLTVNPYSDLDLPGYSYGLGTVLVVVKEDK